MTPSVTRSRLARIERRSLLVTIFAVALAAASRRAMAAHPGTFEEVDGLMIYFVVVPAAFVLGDPQETHGGDPGSRHAHHLLVALFDKATGNRITNAGVTALVQGGRQAAGERIALAPLTIGGAPAYGGVVVLPPRDRYRIEVDVTRPGVPTVTAVFWHQHLQP